MKSPLACPGQNRASRVAKVFFATDRQRDGSGEALSFGPEPMSPPGLTLGWQQVALGQRHRIGQVDSAVKTTPFHEETGPAQTTRSGALQRTDAEIAAYMNSKLRAAIRAVPPPRAGMPRKVLVFIHGYNTTFDDAVRKTAQLAGDLNLVSCDGEAHGVVIAYSWPAQGSLWSYLADEENVEWTQQRLAPFLRSLSRVCREERAELHLVAHSLGARALVRTLADLTAAGNSRGTLIDQVILLAPDMGKGLFDQYVERLLPMAGHLTIYVSSRDRALSLSSFLHGGHQRLGLIKSTVFAALGWTGLNRGSHRELGSAVGTSGLDGKIDMIDVGNSFTTFLGHSYEAPEFISDLRELTCHRTPAGTGKRSNLERSEIAHAAPDNRIDEKPLFFRLKTH
jgi:esterase/lipase superfamily enzyme